MPRYVNQWPEREWAVEGSLGVGRPLAQRLLEAGERVLDVPAKLAARARLLDTGHGRKTDAHDAHSVAVAAVRAKRMRVLAADGQLEALRMLVDHRDQRSSRRVQTVNRLHRLLAEFTPGKAKKDLTALQAKAILCASLRSAHLSAAAAVGVIFGTLGTGTSPDSCPVGKSLPRVLRRACLSVMEQTPSDRLNPFP